MCMCVCVCAFGNNLFFRFLKHRLGSMTLLLFNHTQATGLATSELLFDAFNEPLGTKQGLFSLK